MPSSLVANSQRVLHDSSSPPAFSNTSHHPKVPKVAATKCGRLFRKESYLLHSGVRNLVGPVRPYVPLPGNEETKRQEPHHLIALTARRVAGWAVSWQLQ